jgi:hypothetical protein
MGQRTNMFALSTRGAVWFPCLRAFGLAVVCRPSTRPALIAPILALALLFAAPAAARADCPAQPLAHTFLPWLDPAWYEAAPDGALESGGAGWTLTGGAAVVDGNNPYQPGASALSLPAGASATTAPVCVDIAHPTVRFFARGGSGPLVVTVVFRDLLGNQDELPVGTVLGSAGWSPSAVMPVLGNLLSQQVSFRFTSLGDWRVDDVFVDPYSKG